VGFAAMTTYVAMGDSFTAGLDPEKPRWPDELARSLGPNVHYENLATVGATSEEVEREQLPRAVVLRPDLVTLVCGANDVLESTRPDDEGYAVRLSRMFARLRRAAPHAEILTATYPDLSQFLDLRPRSRARVEGGMRRFNAVCRAVARRHGIAVLEAADHPEAERRTTYAEDGFHPSAEGHRRAAAAFLANLTTRIRAKETAPA
jgi:lysophospholipase L1-like esterase